jgi:hypothetical protein
METILLQMLLQLHPELFTDEIDNPEADMIVNVIMGAHFTDHYDPTGTTDIVSTCGLPDNLKCVIYHLLSLLTDPTSIWAMQLLGGTQAAPPAVKTKTPKSKPAKIPKEVKVKTARKTKTKVVDTSTGIDVDEVARIFLEITTAQDFGTEDKQHAQRIKNSITSKETRRKNVEKKRADLRSANMEEFVAIAEKNARADVERHQQRIQQEIEDIEKQRVANMEVFFQTEREKQIENNEMARRSMESAQMACDLAMRGGNY